MESESANTPLIVIVGETASGKTAAAIEIAKTIKGEIICADSRTIYKFMDIGTAKPSKLEQSVVPHHLINLIEPDENFSAAKFQQLAYKCIREIHARGNAPILVGGTGLYIDSVLYDFQFSNEANVKYREVLEQMTDEELTTLLSTKNIATTNLNTKNRRHVIRTIERNGEIQKQQILRSNTLVLGLNLQRDMLVDRVVKRVDIMFENGFIDEAKNLFKQYKTAESLKTPGYSAARQYLSGDITLQQAKSTFVQADLHLAKRQRTWFKRNLNIEWFQNPEDLITTAIKFSVDNN